MVRYFGEPGNPLSNAGDMDRYLTAYYWALMTVTTVGYGDVAPHTSYERSFAIVAM